MGAEPKTPDGTVPSSASRAIPASERQAKLAEIREALEPILEPRFDDFYLARFLRARKGDVPKAIKMLKEHFKWREEKQIDKLYYNHVSNPKPFPEEADLAKVYPSGYWGVDDLGQIIYYERIGIADSKKVLRICNKDRYVQYFAYQYEKLIWTRFPACRPATPGPDYCDKTLAFIDLQGLSWEHLSSTTRSLFREVSFMASNNYPEIMGRTFVLNAPRIFSFMWSGLKGFIDVDTRNKITVLSGAKKTNQAIDAYIDHELLPDFLGGCVKGVKGVVDYGPWRVESELMGPPSPGLSASHFLQGSMSNETFVTCIEDESESESTTCYACAGCWSWYSQISRVIPPRMNQAEWLQPGGAVIV
eukprot:GEMP01029731.1.p1 GENE.GEMP01029731.1~~GEMP01029731.1.p1  ORF type:complete len:361 (+),score=66.50 GEMP01029731.1:90-1172(+)